VKNNLICKHNRAILSTKDVHQFDVTSQMNLRNFLNSFVITRNH